MLALSRKDGERVVIGDVVVWVVKCGGGKVRLAIDAPDDVKILRGELYDEEVALCGEPAETSPTAA